MVAAVASAATRPALTAATAVILTSATLTTAEAAHDLHPLLKSVGAG
jgi:Rad3-related DNA helicase